MKRQDRRDEDRRQVERRKPKPAVNVRYEDKDRPDGWRPKRMKRAGKQVPDRRENA